MKFKIQFDKVLHFVVSYAITLTLSLFITPLLSALIALGIGLGKELYDKRDYGLFSWPDVVADTCGIAVALAVIFINLSLLG